MRITNKRARYDYRLFDKYRAGISLTGVEVKAIVEEMLELVGLPGFQDRASYNTDYTGI